MWYYECGKFRERGFLVKHFAQLFLPFCFLFAVAPLAARDSQSQFDTIVVKHFVNANGTNQSQEFINYFSDSLRSGLEKNKVASQAVGEGVTVADAVAANSLLIEGKFTDFDKGGGFKVGKLGLEINIYRISDHALVKTITTQAAFKPSPFNKDKNVAEFTGTQTAYQLRQTLKNISLSSIAPTPPSASPLPSSGSAQASPEAVASIQFSSDPSGAEITVDGNYVGNTPSLIKLKPGTHSVKITKNGYAPWVRSINTEAGESRNIAADLEKTSQ
jgi:hypothetical protein